jgi:ATP-dependent helicase/nuclease subunit A
MRTPEDAANLNDGQCAALDLSRDLVVSAGAGAGKTRVLGLRVIALIEEGLARVDEIVAFTFTEKAASEMRSRVQAMLLKRVQELDPRKDAERRERLVQAQAEFSRSRISTVHSFCYRMLTDYAWEAGLEPRPPILDERRQARAREAAIRNVVLRADLEADPELGDALRRLGANLGLRELRGTLAMLLRERFAWDSGLGTANQCWKDPEAELERRLELYQKLVEEGLGPVREIMARVNHAGISGVNLGDSLRGKVDAVTAALATPDVLALKEELTIKSGAPRAVPKGTAKNWKGLDDLRDETRSIVAEAGAELSRMLRTLPPELDDLHERRCGEVLADLHTLFRRACVEYVEACAGGLDFNDLEQRAIRLLEEHPDVRAEVCSRIRYLLVDEYQDTNPVQARLFELLRHEDDAPGRWFAVGDAKQSIYGFRGSDVSIFNRALAQVPARNRAAGLESVPPRLPWGLQCADTPERRGGTVRLDHNYRTVKPLLELGNRIFQKVFHTPDPREFDAKPQDMVAGIPDVPDDGPRAELVFLHAQPGTDEDSYERRKDDEAEWVARRVKALHEDNVPYSHIALLVRRSTRNSHYRAAFARHGIPLLAVGEAGLLQTQEALDCVNLLRALADPTDDIAMLGLLRSPFAGLSDRYLTELALRRGRGGTLYARLLEDLHENERARAFVDRFELLHRRAGRDAPALLLTEALTMSGYALAVGCGFEAEQRLANIEQMLALVRAAQAESPSLAPLVRELVTRIDSGDDEPNGRPEDTADAVQLMTIHKSKGLEFPVVIIPDLGGRTRGGSTGVLRDRPANAEDPVGAWLPRVDDARLGDWDGDLFAVLARKAAAERAEAEERRTLYVGFTRAAERLILLGTTREDLTKDVWLHQLANALDMHDWQDECRDPAMAVRWLEQVERSRPRTNLPHIQAIEAALEAGRVELPEALDQSLVRVPTLPAAAAGPSDPSALEFGTLVHAAIEQQLRLGRVEFGLLGVPDGSEQGSAVLAHTEAFERVRATLPKAAAEYAEFGLLTPEGARRIDWLRLLDGGVYQIVDFKSDRLEGRGDVAAYAHEHYGEQLGGYGKALRSMLNARGETDPRIELYVCFTSPHELDDTARLVRLDT